jgi:hypothetical protein
MTGLAVVWGMWRVQFMRLVPVARELVVEHLRDGIWVESDEGQGSTFYFSTAFRLPEESWEGNWQNRPGGSSLGPAPPVVSADVG